MLPNIYIQKNNLTNVSHRIKLNNFILIEKMVGTRWYIGMFDVLCRYANVIVSLFYITYIVIIVSNLAS